MSKAPQRKPTTEPGYPRSGSAKEVSNRAADRQPSWLPLTSRRRPDHPRRNPDDDARADGFLRIAGVDEAGRGPWAGPVVAAAVMLRPFDVDHRMGPPWFLVPRWRSGSRSSETSRGTQDLVLARIDDSKRLTVRQRLYAFHVIPEYGDVGFGIVSADDIDRCNILQATLLAMREAVRSLPSPSAECVLVDGPIAPAVPMPCRPIIRGDQCSLSIACASIMAKVLRDRLMEFYGRLYPSYHFGRHKGYGTALHAQQLRVHGPSILHRRSFRMHSASRNVSPDDIEQGAWKRGSRNMPAGA